jgi:SAM-dependent methyltransferase
MSATPGDSYHVARDEEYLRQLEVEAAYFDQPRFFSMDAEQPITSAYLNKQFSGDSRVPWYETIDRYGTFRRGCALGAGGTEQRSRMLERHPSLHLTIYDISAESLAEMDRKLGGRFPGRVATQRADLNFVELPGNAYDLIVSASCLHHLLNLEHVAYEINRSLVPEGLFFLHDYVGEARFQFAPEKKRLFEAAFASSKARHPSLRSWRIVWPDLSDWQYSPFEAVRSDETLEILRRFLTEVSLRAGGGLLFLMLHLRPADGAETAPRPAPRSRWRRRLSSVADSLGLHRDRGVAGYAAATERLGLELAPLDRLLAEAGLLRAAVAFGVYRKQSEGQPRG